MFAGKLGRESDSARVNLKPKFRIQLGTTD